MKVSSLAFWNYFSDCKVLFQLIPAHFLRSCVVHFSNLTQVGMHVELRWQCQAESVQGVLHGQKHCLVSQVPTEHRTIMIRTEAHLHLGVSPPSTPEGPKDGIPIKLRKESQHRLPEGIITKGE